MEGGVEGNLGQVAHPQEQETEPLSSPQLVSLPGCGRQGPRWEDLSLLSDPRAGAAAWPSPREGGVAEKAWPAASVPL